jgi:predicted transcriptional regulator YheO
MEKITLNKQDTLILESYKQMIPALASYLGNAYEIVLHSLNNFDHSIIAIENGFHTGRKVGDPITDLAKYWLKENEDKHELIQSSYYTKNKLGEPLRSTTIIIRGTNNKSIGVLCINFYLGTPFINLISDMMPEQVLPFTDEHFTTDPDIVEIELKNAHEQIRKNNSITASQRKKEIIRILYSKNVFSIKNSVEQVANALDISINTVYFHLRNIAKETN